MSDHSEHLLAHRQRCGNPSGQVIVRYREREPRVRFLHCADCEFWFGVEVLDADEPVPAHICTELCSGWGVTQEEGTR